MMIRKKKFSIFITLLIIPLVFLSTYKKTYSLDFDDISNIADQLWTLSKNKVLEPIVISIADSVITKMSDDTVNWANGGFDGGPGFINNYEDFLKGKEHDSISKSFDLAAKKSGEYIKDLRKCNKIKNKSKRNHKKCIKNLDETKDAEKISNCQKQIERKNNEYNMCAKDLKDKYNSSKDKNENLKKTTEDKGAQNHKAQQSEETEDESSQQAKQNYEAQQSGELKSSRLAATTIADSGSKRLNQKPLENLIDGKDDTLSQYLGSKKRKDRFIQNIKEGGWEPFMALISPGSTELGFTDKVKSTLNQAVTKEIKITKQDINLPSKQLDITACIAWEKEEDGKIKKDKNGKKICNKKHIGTPGSVVEAKLNQALGQNLDKANSFSGKLVGILIKGLARSSGRLLDGGLSSLTKTTTKALFSPKSTKNLTEGGLSGGEYQSEYDVLGISNDFGNDFAGVDIPKDQKTPSKTTRDPDFIGGPEDIVTSGKSPQIIINLQEELQKNINFSKEEEEYFDKAKAILKKSNSTAIDLDRCLPGPDYNWEERYKDTFDINGEDNIINRLGFIETKEMVNDSLVNIPGSLVIKGIFGDLIKNNKQELLQLKYRKNQLKNLIRELYYIKNNIKKNNQNLVLFEEDWSSLTKNQKIAALKKTAVGSTKTADISQKENSKETKGYILIKKGESLEQIIDEDEGRAKNAVFSMGWNTWRKTTKKEEKDDLRYIFYNNQNNLSNKQFIQQAKNNYIRVDAAAADAKKLLSDCLVLQLYTRGEEVSSLKNKISGNSLQILSSKIKLGELLLGATLPPAGNLLYQSDGEAHFINTSKARKNVEIKKFLEHEYEIYNDKNPNTESLFSTEYLISPSAIQDSLLGFDNSKTRTVDVQISARTEEDLPLYDERTLPETSAYFEENYPDFEFKNLQKNSLELINLWKKDRFFSSFTKARGFRGILFCRLIGSVDLHKGRRKNFQPKCIEKNWYRTSSLEYKILFEETNL